jgi:hypothetical protein
MLQQQEETRNPGQSPRSARLKGKGSGPK